MLGIDGRGDMKLIYGIIVAEKKVKPGKEDKVLTLIIIILTIKNMISISGFSLHFLSPQNFRGSKGFFDLSELQGDSYIYL